MNNTMQLYIDKDKQVKGYPITTPDRVVNEKGISIQQQINDNIKFDVVGQGSSVPSINKDNSSNDTAIIEKINTINAEIIEARDGEEKLGIKIRKVNEQLDNIKDIIKNNKKINVLNYGFQNDGITDNTALIEELLTKGLTNLYFPKGKYVISINCISKITIEGDGINETFLLQKPNSNKNIIDIIDGVSYISIKNIALLGNENNMFGHGVFIKGSLANLYCNYVFLENVKIENIIEDGLHVEGYSVENKLTNCIINNCKKRNIYSEGHDLLILNAKLQRAGMENLILKGSNNFATNLQVIYGNMLQKDLDKNSNDLRYSMVINGDRGSYNNIDCQDCFGHGVLIENANDVLLSNFLVDAVGINKDETEWWLPNDANNCIGFNIKNSNVIANSCTVTNWHQNAQGASYVIDSTSSLKGEITRSNENNIVKKPIIKTADIYGLAFEDRLFEGMKYVLNKSSIDWGYSLVHSGSPVFNSARYGKGVYFNNVANNMKIEISTMQSNNDLEISFTYTPKIASDNTNTR